MAYEWQSDIIRPDGENGTEVLDGQGVYQPQIEGGDNITIEDGRINASGTLENVQADYTETDTSAPSYIKHKPDLSIYATASGMETELAGKQDVIEDLSTIRSGAEAGSTAVQPGDLATVATTGSYTSLSNTPQNIVQDASYVHTDNNFTNADKGKLDGIAAGAEVNVQSDWLEADPNSDAYIANKPTIPSAQQNADWNASSGVTAILNKPDLSAYATDSELANGLATKQNIISDLDSIRSGASAGATAVQPSQLPSSDELLPSATSGDAGKILSVDANGDPEWITPSGGTTYSAGDGVSIDANNVISADVDGTTIGIDSTTKKIKSLQTIPTKTSDLQNDSNFVVASSLATVATSGSYADLSNKPAIPTKTSDLQNDSNFVSSSSLATVATTGNYSDLSGKPTIPSVDQTYNAYSTNAQSGAAVAQAIAAIPAPSVDEVPDVTSSDDGKVLTAAYSGGTGSYSWQPASGGGGSYTAGDGIAIESGEISVDYDSDTLDTVVGVSTESVTDVNHSTYGDFLVLPTDISNMATGSDNVQITLHIPGNTFYFSTSADPLSYYPAHVGFAELRTSQTTGNLFLYEYNQYLVVNLTGTFDSAAQKCWLNEQDVSITLPVSATNNWVSNPIAGSVINGLVFSLYNQYQPVDYELLFKCDSDTLTNPVTFTYSGGSHEVLTVKNPLPDSTSADANKVLTVDSNGAAGWQTPSTVTVDQTYNASSSNAQSGTAVAQAIASIPSASYTAGDGIAIESGEISVDYDSNTLDTVAATTTVSVSYVDQYDGFTLPSDLQDMQTQSDTVNVTVHIPANTFKCPYNKGDDIFAFTLCRGLATNGVNSYVDAPLSYTTVSSTEYWINEQDIVITLPTLQTNGWEFDTNLRVLGSFNIAAKTPGVNSHTFLTTISDNGNLASPVTFTYQGGSHEILTVKNPLPASTSVDANKVLKVNASGNAEWGTDGFTTTAGITDIQQVSALPANPVATVLYLIPET